MSAGSWPELARWELPADLPCFAGHFPGRPMLPGALLLDWVIDALEGSSASAVASVAQCKFLAPAEPGACLTLHALGERFEVRLWPGPSLEANSPRVAASGAVRWRQDGQA